MIKAILFDADGVVIKPRSGIFSDRLARNQNISQEEVSHFFKNEFNLCVIGKADLKEELVKYLPKWKWAGSIDELLNFWFSAEKDIDNSLLEAVDQLRENRIKCYLATDQEKYRAGYIKREMGLEERFDGIFFSCDLGYKKSQSEFFRKIMTEINLKPEEVQFWDDSPEKVATALSAGIDAKLYTTFSDFQKAQFK